MASCFKAQPTNAGQHHSTYAEIVDVTHCEYQSYGVVSTFGLASAGCVVVGSFASRRPAVTSVVCKIKAKACKSKRKAEARQKAADTILIHPMIAHGQHSSEEQLHTIGNTQIFLSYYNLAHSIIA